MAKVHFFYSTMNAGKSTALLQSNHNYQETGMHTILFIPKEDVSKNSGSIKSRIGLKAPAVVLDKKMNLFNFVKDKDAVQKIDAVLIDEVKFLNKKSSRRVLTDMEESQLHWEIANAYFIFNKDYESITEASKSLVISNGKHDSAWLTAGLASWRRGDLKRARLFFTNLANLEK